MGKNLSNKYSQKLFDAKKSTVGAIKTSLKIAIQKTAEITGDLIGNKIADKITSFSKSSVELRSKNDDANSEIKVPKKIHISRSRATNYWWIKVSKMI